ncbi:hypothetical protein EVA_14697 [gut metagenome]|uniref:Uncharacterized protein n=1 Tax=gut metagenome TaxID=749906 RepID=J9FQH6_9ZZZZ
MVPLRQTAFLRPDKSSRYLQHCKHRRYVLQWAVLP